MLKNKKRKIALLLCVSLILTMSAGCGDSSESKQKADTTSAAATTEETAEPDSAETTTTAAETTSATTTTTTATATESADSAMESSSTDSMESTSDDIELADGVITGDISIDSLEPENAKNFKKFLNKTGLKGHFEDKANVTSQFYFLPNKTFYHEQTPGDVGEVMLMCTIDEAKPYLSDDLLSFYEADGVKYLVVREWTEDEWELYKLDRKENLDFQPYWTYEWEEGWNDIYIDDYVFVPDE